ncbi:MAG: YveK family protein [Clostridium sp.]
MEKEGVELQEIFHLIKKKIVLILAIVLGTVALVGVYAFVIKKPTYTGSVKIFSGKNEEAQNYTIAELESNAVLMNTYIQLIKTDNFMNEVIKKSGVSTTADVLKNTVKFTTDGKTPILEIAYTSSDEVTAKKLISAITENFEKEVKATILNINTKVIENVKVVKNNANKQKLILLGAGIGLILAIGIILIIDFMDNTIKSKNELEKLIPVPVLGELNKDKRLLK